MTSLQPRLISDDLRTLGGQRAWRAHRVVLSRRGLSEDLLAAWVVEERAGTNLDMEYRPLLAKLHTHGSDMDKVRIEEAFRCCALGTRKRLVVFSVCSYIIKSNKKQNTAHAHPK